MTCSTVGLTTMWSAESGGNDVIDGGTGDDALGGGGGDDIISGGAGDDWISGDGNLDATTFNWSVNYTTADSGPAIGAPLHSTFSGLIFFNQP